MNAKNIYDAFIEIEEQRRIIEKYHKEIQRLNTQIKSEQNKVAVEKLEEVFKKVRQVVIVTDDDNDDYSVITLWGLKKVINSMIKELNG